MSKSLHEIHIKESESFCTSFVKCNQSTALIKYLHSHLATINYAQAIFYRADNIYLK